MKFRGPVGFVEIVEKRPGVKTSEAVEHSYSGDVLKRSIRFHSESSTVNDSISPSNQISILADPYARNHMGSIRYVKWQGTAWKVTEVSVQHPRLILTLGGAYNGATVRSSDSGA